MRSSVEDEHDALAFLRAGVRAGSVRHPMTSFEARELASAGTDDLTPHRSEGVHTPAGATGAGLASNSITSTFSAHVLNVIGDGLDNPITVSRDAAGTLLVDGGAVSVRGGTPTVANTSLIQIVGQGGNDTLTLDEANGALPPANLFGGAGDDVLTGGSHGDLLFGQSGNDTLLGKGGNDFLFGGSGNDVLIGGDGNDQMFGESGNDRFIWNPGDDSDRVEGGDGTDTLEVNGGNGAETFTITPNGSRVRVDRVDPAPFFIDAGTVENIVINANGGDDVISAANGLSGLVSLTINGGAGNDTILGGDGADRLLGGDGNDFIDGNRGNDSAFLGAGDDVFQWDAGDGSDVVEGDAGTDTLLFNGANAAENIDISANGSRVRMTRDVGTVTMDLNGIERIDLHALGGADNINVGDLSGTDVTAVDIDLAGAAGGTTGDGLVDHVTVGGSKGDDRISILGSDTSATVVGLPATVSITHADTQDQLSVNAGDGNDVIDASTLPATVIALTVDGGAGNDTILGGRGNDHLFGGDGNDFVDGNQGSDIAFLGAGDDVFQWDPGDGSDTVEGDAGNDTMLFNGANVSESIDISANGARARFVRDVASITMDLGSVEHIVFNALGGADTINVEDLSGSGVNAVDIALAGTLGGTTGDGQIDTVLAHASAGDDVVTVTGAAGTIDVGGTPAQIHMTGVEVTDGLTIEGGAGADTIDAGALAGGLVQLTLNGGDGNDTIIGSGGADLVNGGHGSDTALMGAGDDVFVWNPGDGSDIVEGEAGHDTMVFNGNGANERIDILADGERVRLTRDVGTVTMDNNGVEQINVNALGGTDTIVVGDLSGTDLQQVNIDLTGVIGGTAGDGQTDIVRASATSGDDFVTLTGDASTASLDGLAAQVNVAHFDAANDRLEVQLLGGDDVFSGATMPAGSLALLVDGGEGDDILLGGAGNDILLGGAGDDTLIGGGGQDVLDGGAGNNVIIASAAGGSFQVNGFNAAGSQDRIDLSQFGADADFAWVMAHAQQVDGNVLVDLGAEQMTLAGVDLGSLSADDFIFGAPDSTQEPLLHDAAILPMSSEAHG